MKKRFLDYLGIILGCFIIAMGFNLFLIPNKIAPGGLSGLATILYYLFGFPVGMTMLVFNIPLLVIGVKKLGLHFGTRTIFGSIVLSLLIDGTAPFLPTLTTNILLAVLFGGVIMGLGLGIVFKFKGTTGGTDIIARLICDYTDIRMGQAMLMMDFVVITCASFVFRDADLGLYALIAIYVASKAIDLAQGGVNYAKAALIISDHTEIIGEAILKNMGRGVTALKGQGLYTQTFRDVLLCVLPRSEVSELKDIVKKTDQKAFVIITNVYEVLGEGFEKYQLK